MTTEQGMHGPVSVPDPSDISMDIIGPILRGEKVYADFLQEPTQSMLSPMSIAPRTGEHIIIVDKPSGSSFGYAGPENSLQSFADVVHWYPGWVEGNELAGWYSSSYGGDQKTPFPEENMLGWMRIPQSVHDSGVVKPRVVCLCGSTRFYEEFQKANYDETMKGNIVLSVGFFPHSSEQAHSEKLACTDEQKTILDELHKRKIDMADEILVINVGGYVGDSTRSEINYAITHGKHVRYLSSYTQIAPNNDSAKSVVVIEDLDKRLASFRSMAGAFPDMEFPDREPVDMLERLFEMQSNLNNHIFKTQDIRDLNYNVLTMETLLELAQETIAECEGKAVTVGLTVDWLSRYHRALTDEVKEVGEEIRWKFWSKSKSDISKIQEELVDVLHFWISLVLVSGMDARTVFQVYLKKNQTNIERQNQGYIARGDISNASA
jgi:dimeric dUTPase (all-alpha-NTP-PPase superfamily)